MNREISPDLGSCMQEVLRKGIRLQSQQVIHGKLKFMLLKILRKLHSLPLKGRKVGVLNARDMVMSPTPVRRNYFATTAREMAM